MLLSKHINNNKGGEIMPGYGWKYGRRWQGYFADVEIDRDTVEKSAKKVLDKAKKGDEWKSPVGVKHIPILVDDEPVGNLWEDEKLSKLEIGSYWAASFGIKAELLHKDKVVGMLWVPQE